MAENLKLGDILVSKGVITAEQRDEALDVQKSTGEMFGEIIVDHGWATEEKILKALSEQFNMEFLRLDLTQTDWSAAQYFSPSLLLEHKCFPIRRDDQKITVAISDPLNAWTVSALEKHSRGRKIEIVLSTKQDIETAIREFGKKTLDKNS